MPKTEALMTENTNIMFPKVMKDTNMNDYEEKQTFIRSVMFGASNSNVSIYLV